MSFRIRGGKQYPQDLDLRNIGNVDADLVKQLGHIFVAKAASQGSLEDVAALFTGLNSNANVVQPFGEMMKQMEMLTVTQAKIAKQLESLK